MKKRVIIVGGVNKVSSLSKSLIKKGCDVTVINNNMDDCNILSMIEDITVIYGDGSSVKVLEEAEVYDSDIVIALTHLDHDNLAICQISKNTFSVKKTVATVNDIKNIQLFYDLGVDSVLSYTSMLTGLIEQQALVDEVKNILPIDSDIIMLELSITEEAPVVGKKLKEIGLPDQSIVGLVLRAEGNLVPDLETRIFEGDTLMLILRENDKENVMKQVLGLE